MLYIKLQEVRQKGDQGVSFIELPVSFWIFLDKAINLQVFRLKNTLHKKELIDKSVSILSTVQHPTSIDELLKWLSLYRFYQNLIGNWSINRNQISIFRFFGRRWTSRFLPQNADRVNGLCNYSVVFFQIHPPPSREQSAIHLPWI